MRPVDGAPGLYRLNTGQLANIKDYITFETSERLEGLRWESWNRKGSIFSRTLHIIQGWRLTCASMPSPVEQQQLVKFTVHHTQRVAEKTVQRLLSIPGVLERNEKEERLQDIEIEPDSLVEVELTERPLEGCGLRVHLYGLRRKLVMA